MMSSALAAAASASAAGAATDTTAIDPERDSNRGEHRIPTMTTLGIDQGPLVWIDLEMTGLDVHKDEIMEIAVILTNGNLEAVDGGVQYVINVDREKLESMDEWCTQQHRSTGLTQACLNSHHTLPSVENAVLDYIRKYIPERKVGVLAGNSVHVDRMFLAERMPRLLEYLHYRIVDVSSIKELSRRWYNGLVAPRMVKESDAHRALDDIRGSIKELQWYRDHIFAKSGEVTSNRLSGVT